MKLAADPNGGLLRKCGPVLEMKRSCQPQKHLRTIALDRMDPIVLWGTMGPSHGASLAGPDKMK